MSLGIQDHKLNIQTLINRLIPISHEHLDQQGNRVRLWEMQNANFFCGTVLDSQGRIKVIPWHKIINPLGKNSAAQALQKIKELKNVRLDLSYLKQTDEITIWPHLIAAAKDQIQGFSSIEAKENQEWQQPRFPEQQSVLGHIFKKSKGHLEQDTPENRAYILQAVLSPKNKVGVDAFGKEIYFKIMPDGTQAWAHVQNGIIKSGGCNRIPMQWIVDPKLDQGGKLVPLKTHAHPPNAHDFVERIYSFVFKLRFNQEKFSG